MNTKYPETERNEWAEWLHGTRASATSTAASRRLARTWEALTAAGKVEATPSTPATATPDPTTPLLRETAEFAEALRRIRSGDLVEASAPSTTSATHKLPPHTVYG